MEKKFYSKADLNKIQKYTRQLENQIVSKEIRADLQSTWNELKAGDAYCNIHKGVTMSYIAKLLNPGVKLKEIPKEKRKRIYRMIMRYLGTDVVSSDSISTDQFIKLDQIFESVDLGTLLQSDTDELIDSVSEAINSSDLEYVIGVASAVHLFSEIGTSDIQVGTVCDSIDSSDQVYDSLSQSTPPSAVSPRGHTPGA